jgi:hypothetical protein
MKDFFARAAQQDHPLRALERFLAQEHACEAAKRYDEMRFVGYVLDIGFDTVTVITSDPFKTAVGGVPRNSLLVMVPSVMDGLPLHFTLLRVLQAAPTPLSTDVQHTYFELQKKSMPELDVFTQAELQWGALQTGVLGMFYGHPEQADEIEFSGDLNNFVSAHKYRVYAPTDELLDLIVNGMLPADQRFPLGRLRLTECRLPLVGRRLPAVDVRVSAGDFRGTRTALFGKTRLGKSNVVKLIAESVIATTEGTRSVGQLIFDSDGEYANDNPQDQNASLASAYRDRCLVYAITPKKNTPSRPLKLNFYAQPRAGLRILAALLGESGKTLATYVTSFLAVDLPDLEQLAELPHNEQLRARRKVLMFWAVLHRAGYAADTQALRGLLSIDPGFSAATRAAIYSQQAVRPTTVTTLDELATELELAALADRSGTRLQSASGNNLFDPDDGALLGMLRPVATMSSGPTLLRPFIKYHSAQAGDFVREILEELDRGTTVILDLGNAAPEVMSYFSAHLSREIFAHQVDKFSNNALGVHYVQLYFEEAHNLFPVDKPLHQDIYQRLAKEGAKYHIGMLYSTQSVTTINKDLLAQTENFFVAHMSSQAEVRALGQVNVAFAGFQDDILVTRTPGYIRMLTRSHRFVIPVQARRFAPPGPNSGATVGGLGVEARVAPVGIN